MKNSLTLLLIAVAFWACSDSQAFTVATLPDLSVAGAALRFLMLLSALYLAIGFLWLIFVTLYFTFHTEMYPSYREDWQDLLSFIRSRTPYLSLQVFALIVSLATIVAMEVLAWPWNAADWFSIGMEGDEK